MKIAISCLNATEARLKRPHGNHDIVFGTDDIIVIEIPDPEPGSSVLALSLRTEADDTDVQAPHTSLAYREVYVASRGGMTFRTH